MKCLPESQLIVPENGRVTLYLKDMCFSQNDVCRILLESCDTLQKNIGNNNISNGDGPISGHY